MKKIFLCLILLFFITTSCSIIRHKDYKRPITEKHQGKPIDDSKYQDKKFFWDFFIHQEAYAAHNRYHDYRGKKWTNEAKIKFKEEKHKKRNKNKK